ncbi:hypothetical protein RRG08_007702 [Elysia crispata]|uniref:Uncharacterized protein n=1 Tax=Elysia crispata TaxID=231223 RepID=A0AAE0YU24_9GAST|nr:hypothetical protein RRG08_007702 [Elysia crispata]
MFTLIFVQFPSNRRVQFIKRLRGGPHWHVFSAHCLWKHFSIGRRGSKVTYERQFSDEGHCMNLVLAACLSVPELSDRRASVEYSIQCNVYFCSPSGPT